MPRYDYQCENGHVFERDVPLSQFDYAQKCDCGAMAKQIWLTAPGMFATDGGIVAREREIYAQHNVTHEGGGETVSYKPNSHSMQCGCEVCSRHRKRALVTETADVGKDVHLGR